MRRTDSFREFFRRLFFVCITSSYITTQKKLPLEARVIILRSIVRQASRTLLENEAQHIRFLNTKILNLLDRYGFPRNVAARHG